MQTQAKATNKGATNKGATNKGATVPTPATSTAAILAVANAIPPVQSAAQPVKKPAVVYVNGIAAGAPANAPAVSIAGTAYNGALPATNPANRGAVGTVKNPNAILVAGNGKQPKSAHGATAFAAVLAALATGKGSATAQALANAAGHGGGAFIAYCLKNGWLAAK